MLAETVKRIKEKFGYVVNQKSDEGFTMVEIVLVIALMGGLIAYLVSNLVSTSEEAKKDQSRLAMGVISQSLQMYRIHNNRYPTTAQGLNSLVTDPGNAKSWRGPYIESGKLVDPWGEDFTYESDGRNFKIITGGPDFAIGGDDDISYPESKE